MILLECTSGSKVNYSSNCVLLTPLWLVLFDGGVSASSLPCKRRQSFISTMINEYFTPSSHWTGKPFMLREQKLLPFGAHVNECCGSHQMARAMHLFLPYHLTSCECFTEDLLQH